MIVALTDSEKLFEQFLSEHGVPFERISTGTSRTPDYLVTLKTKQVAVEVTSIKGGVEFHDGGSWSRTVGDAIREKITDKRTQLKWAEERNLASLLLMFDSQSPGLPRVLEDMDFETAMYGERTFKINRKTLRSGLTFNGQNKKLRPDTNTHISSLGRINYSFQQKLEVTIFPNLFAKIAIDKSKWPVCFAHRHFEIEYVDTEPLAR